MIGFIKRRCVIPNQRIDNTGARLVFAASCLICGKDCLRWDTVHFQTLHRDCRPTYVKSQLQVSQLDSNSLQKT